MMRVWKRDCNPNHVKYYLDCLRNRFGPFVQFRQTEKFISATAGWIILEAEVFESDVAQIDNAFDKFRNDLERMTS